MKSSELKRKLREAASIGLDLSPGDPLAEAALDEIENLEDEIRDLQRVIADLQRGII